MDGWMDESLMSLSHKQWPNRNGSQHSNEVKCTYGTDETAVQHRPQHIPAGDMDPTWYPLVVFIDQDIYVRL